jgi:hypothetical protein
MMRASGLLKILWIAVILSSACQTTKPDLQTELRKAVGYLTVQRARLPPRSSTYNEMTDRLINLRFELAAESKDGHDWMEFINVTTDAIKNGINSPFHADYYMKIGFGYEQINRVENAGRAFERFVVMTLGRGSKKELEQRNYALEFLKKNYMRSTEDEIAFFKKYGGPKFEPYVRDLRYQECLKGSASKGRLTKTSFVVCKNPPKGGSQGGLTVGEITSVIKFNLKFIRACYDQGLKRNPGATGKISVKFEILNMKVRKVQIMSQTGPLGQTTIKCVNREISDWVFPKQRGKKPVTVNYPFIFP